MLEIIVPKPKDPLFNNETNTFYYIEKDHKLCLEHSLVSLSKWESKWHKPFLSNEKKSAAEILDYIKCMTITQNVDDVVYHCLTENNMRDINAYIENTMSATTFRNNKPVSAKHSNEPLTSELIYYWMVYYNIPPEYQKWHLNRLLTLIRICNIKNSDSKMSKKDIYAQNAALNAARRAKFGTKG